MNSYSMNNELDGCFIKELEANECCLYKSQKETDCMILSSSRSYRFVVRFNYYLKWIFGNKYESLFECFMA